MNDALTFDDVQIIPKYSEVTSRDMCSVQSQLTRRFLIDVPIIAAPMDTVSDVTMCRVLDAEGAIGTLHRFNTIQEQCEGARSLSLEHHINEIIAAVGSTGDFMERTEALLYNHVNIILIDVAHGHHLNVKQAIQSIKNAFGKTHTFDIIAGNVATKEGALALQEWGADAVRVGVGGGALCETRVRTGIGVPQLHAIQEIATSVDIPVISDGGIRFAGDVAKALAAGADTVMIGSLFAGTTEAPGEKFAMGQWPNEMHMKLFRGSASASQKQANGAPVRHVEGASKLIPMKGSVRDVVATIVDGVKSSMSYVGAKSLSEFRTNAEFIRITPSGLAEAHPHGL
jgi:IMP dehydrogenase